METLNMVLPQWDEYRADETGERWATSDRGWCFDVNRGDYEHNCIGNYLTYGGDGSYGPNGETVHACAYHMENLPLSHVYTTFRHGSGWFHTIEEAKAFIEAAAQNR